MKLNKSIATLAILGVTILLGADLNSVNALVDQINSTNDAQKKSELLKELDNQLKSLDDQDAAKANEIVSQRLQVPVES